MTFPTLPASRTRAFENQRNALKSAAGSEAVARLAASTDTTSLSSEAARLKAQLLKVDNQEAEIALKYSIAGRLGTALETFSQWSGFDWRTNIALIGGFAAKEVIVSTLGTAYSLGQVDPEKSESLAQTLANSPNWSPLAAFSLIIFVMFYSPCFVATVCIAKEAGSIKWGVFAMVFNTLLAFMLAVTVFQAGRFIGF